MRKTLASKTELEIRKILAHDYGIHKISITGKMFDFAVNSFFVEKPYPTLIDVPPDHKVYLEKLQTGLKEICCSLYDIKLIIVTHPHFDHFGAAQTISELSGAEVWVTRKGAHWLQDFERESRSEEIARTEFLRQAGAVLPGQSALLTHLRQRISLCREKDDPCSLHVSLLRFSCCRPHVQSPLFFFRQGNGDFLSFWHISLLC